MLFITLFIVSLVIFLVLDLIWLPLAFNYIYKQEIGHMIKADINFFAAGLFYLIFVVGIVVFVLMPSVEAKSLTKAALLGALLGFVAYATYDLTNLATMEGFTIKVAVIDLIWGTFVGSATATLSYIVHGWLFK